MQFWASTQASKGNPPFERHTKHIYGCPPQARLSIMLSLHVSLAEAGDGPPEALESPSDAVGVADPAMQFVAVLNS